MTVRAVLCQSFQCGEESGSRTTAAHQCACWCAPGPRASDSISTCRITDVQFWWLMCPPAPLITEPIHQRWLTFNTSETAELFTSQLHEDTHGYNIWRIEQLLTTPPCSSLTPWLMMTSSLRMLSWSQCMLRVWWYMINSLPAFGSPCTRTVGAEAQTVVWGFIHDSVDVCFKYKSPPEYYIYRYRKEGSDRPPSEQWLWIYLFSTPAAINSRVQINSI